MAIYFSAMDGLSGIYTPWCSWSEPHTLFPWISENNEDTGTPLFQYYIWFDLLRIDFIVHGSLDFVHKLSSFCSDLIDEIHFSSLILLQKFWSLIFHLQNVNIEDLEKINVNELKTSFIFLSGFVELNQQIFINLFELFNLEFFLSYCLGQVVNEQLKTTAGITMATLVFHQHLQTFYFHF